MTTDNVTPFPTPPQPRQYTFKYTENAFRDEELQEATAVGYLVELGVFTGISEEPGVSAANHVTVMVPTMNIVRINSEAVEVVN